MLRRKFLLPAMVVLTLLLCSQFPIRIRAYQDAAPAAAPAKTDWLQFALTPDKTADNTAETTLNTSNVSGLQLLFNVALPAADNPDGAPVLLTNVNTPSGVRDLIFVQGEHGHLSAFDANNGAVIWTKTFGTGGTNNSAPAIDPNRMFVYVDTNDGFFHKLNVGDGSEVMGGGWPEPHGGGKGGSELTIATAANGHTYLYGSNHGNGHITTVDVNTGTQHVFNASCSQFADIHNPGGCTSTGARPWARGNPFIPALDKFFFMTGNNNGAAWNGCTMWKESWLALPADGSTRLASGCGFPADSWTGTDVATTVARDQDVGAGGLTPLPIGLSSKFPHLGVNPGKDARIRILNLDNLSGLGGPGHQGGSIVQLAYPMGSLMRAQSAVWTDPAGHVWVFVTGNSGTHGFTVDVDAGGNPSLNNHWNIQNGWTTSAVVANGVLFTAADGGEHTGTGTVHRVQAINPTTGAILWTGAIDLFHWASPIVVNGTVYMADGNSGGFGGPGGHLRAWRLTGIVNNPDFSIAATPPSQTVNQGSTAAYNVTVGSINSFTGSVNLGVNGLPTGATASFSKNPITGGSGSSTLAVTTASTTPAGTYTLTVSGNSTSPSLSHSTTVTLMVNGPPPPPDFTLTASPASQTVTAGGGTTYTATVGALNGFTGTVALSVSGQPAGATASLTPTSVTGSGTSTLSVTTSGTTPTGTSTLTITGTSGSLTHTATVTLIVSTLPPPCVTASATHGWVNTAFATQTGTFTTTFDATPSLSHMNSVVGISHGAGTAYNAFANLVAFNGTMGVILARDGGSYSGPTPAILYSGGNTYHFRLVVNVPAHTYSIFVTPPGGSELTIGSNFHFRTEQNTVMSLDNLGVFVGATSGTLQVCNFTVQ